MRVSDKDPDASARRTIGLGLGVAVVLGEVVGDAGIMVTPGAAAEHAGSGVLLALVVAGVVALATGTSGAQLGAAIPISGGGFTWARKCGYPPAVGSGWRRVPG